MHDLNTIIAIVNTLENVYIHYNTCECLKAKSTHDVCSLRVTKGYTKPVTRELFQMLDSLPGYITSYFSFDNDTNTRGIN